MRAGVLLRSVILQSQQGGAAEEDDDRQVDQGHHAHEHIGQVPHGADLHPGADEDQELGSMRKRP